MTHQRKSIRDAIVALLTDATTAGASVYSSRVRAIDETDLPMILVYANTETASIYQEAPRELERVLSVDVKIVAKADDDLDDALDAIADEVENVLMQDDSLGGLCDQMLLKNTELTLTPEGDTLLGSCVLTYEVNYYTYSVADQTEDNHVNDLETVDAVWARPELPTGQEDAEDTLSLVENNDE